MQVIKETSRIREQCVPGAPSGFSSAWERGYLFTVYICFYWQVTYAFATLVSESLNFAHHFRMVPSDTHLTDGIVSFILHFEWERIKVIVEEQPVYITVSYLSITGAHNNSLETVLFAITTILSVLILITVNICVLLLNCRLAFANG